MDAASWLALAGLLLAGLPILGGGIWTVAIVKATTDNLRSAIRELTGTIRELKNMIHDIEEVQTEHEIRISSIESGRRRD